MIATMREECRRCRGTADNINHFESIRHEGSRGPMISSRCRAASCTCEPFVSGRPDGSANYQHSGALSSERDLRRNLIARVVFSSSFSTSLVAVFDSLFRNVLLFSRSPHYCKRGNNSDGNKTRSHNE